MPGGRCRAVGAGLHQPRQIRHMRGHIRLRGRPLPHPGWHRRQHRAEFLSHRRVFGAQRVARRRGRQQRTGPRTAAQQRRLHLRRKGHPDRRGHRQPPAIGYDDAASLSPVAQLAPDPPTPAPKRPSSCTPRAASAACSSPRTLNSAVLCSATGSTAPGTTVVIDGAAPACAPARRAVNAVTAAPAAAVGERRAKS
jgi:hypothetical protein